MNKNIKKVLSLFLILMVFASFSGFSYYEGIGNVHYDANKQIYIDTYYGEQIGQSASSGNQHAYFVSTNLAASGLVPIVYSGQVRSVSTVGTMVKDVENTGYNVIAAINGDIFDTSSGAPKGLTMHAGNIISSGYQSEKVVVFDSEGKASLQPTSLTYSIKGEIRYNSGNNITTTTDQNGVVLDTPILTPEVIQTAFKRNIDFINVPHGGAQGLHLYNRHYAESTKTQGSCIEVVLDCGNSDNTQLRVGKHINATVKAVNVDARNTPIGVNEIVLSTPAGSASASQLYSMIVGSNVEIEVSSNGNSAYDNATEALGVYYTILENGQLATGGTNLNPRTAVGIKADGSVVLYVLDGRSANAKGLGLTDLAKHMKALGCVHVANLDGGGSSTFYARLSGLENAAGRKNLPSGGGERKVSNGLLLAYKKGGFDSEISNLAIYPAQTLLLAGSKMKFDTAGLNSKFEIVRKGVSPTYSIDKGEGTVDANGMFTAGINEGNIKISASLGNAKGETNVTVVKRGLTIAPSIAGLKINPKETKDINMKVMQGNINVVSDDNVFTFSCDKNIGSIDEQGVFTAGDRNGERGYIYIKFQNYDASIPVQVGDDIQIFSDIEGHWAKKEITELASKGVINGIGNNMFNPDGKLTRAQFLTMLAKLSGEDVSKSPPQFFYDVKTDDWFAPYVYWGIEKGITNGSNPNEFSPSTNITREQMCTMLCKYAIMKQITLPQKNSYIAFKDQNKVSYWATDYIMTMAGSGIVNGTPDGNFEPQQAATRAQSAMMIFKFIHNEDEVK